jgi:hypothetical protein
VKFVELITKRDNRLQPREQNEWADRKFLDLLHASAMQSWNPGEPVPQVGQWLLIGAATWSLYDLQLLDKINDILKAKASLPKVAVFNIDDIQSNEDFGLYFPGIGRVYQTPVVGLWQEGVLVDKGTGHFGRVIAERVTVEFRA